MTEDEEYFLAHEALDGHEWAWRRAARKRAQSIEPLAKRGNLGEVVAERLVRIGLAEKGPCSDRYASTGIPTGYRLSELGVRVLDHGRYPRRRRA
jgi:hypothetical protein